MKKSKAFRAFTAGILSAAILFSAGIGAAQISSGTAHAAEGNCVTAYAAEKVTKVTLTRHDSGTKEYAILRGKSKNGKVVWKRRTSSFPAMQSICFMIRTRGKYVYLVQKDR